MSNPYWGNNFFTFFATLYTRLKGDLPLSDLPSDEVQLLVLLGIACSCALLGVFLNLKKMTMLANSLSHTVLLGILAVYLLTSSFYIDLSSLVIAAVIAALATTFLTQFFTQFLHLQEDASIGLVFTTLFALGIVGVTLFTKNGHLGTEAIMGNVDALDKNDVHWVYTILALNTCVIFLSLRGLTITAFDPGFARAQGISLSLFNYLLMLLTAFTLVGAFRAVGVLLVLSFLTAPVLITRLWAKRLAALLCGSCLTGCLLALVGVALSRHFLSVYAMPLSTGALVVTVMGLFYLLTFRVTRWFNRGIQTAKP